ncbi:sulfotransferase [Pseudomonas gingeri]|uniref:sulfotransferase family protein n=1 Tax=Pseudomonas gingeri TaxID=117681 RepID=UPI0015A20E29|nr:sulfotransferase [Pseudomonas gingeri]NVZ27936.1 sulfotransferase [Pseudomonas gingeri]
MATQFHAISGLPRSGSTLLSALLRQNPRFSAAITSPVAALVGATHAKMCGGEFGSFFDDHKRGTILRAVVESYYTDQIASMPEDRVLFDTNRTWTGRAALWGALYPPSRIICCVREVGWIIDSIERMLAKNPLELSRMFNFQPGASVYARAETLMNSDTGLIGLAWSNLREAWFSEQAKRLILVPYDHLVKDPRRTLERLYTELGQPWFEHDLQNVVYDEPDYDAQLGMPGLHTVRKTVEYQARPLCIPPDLFARYSATSFWNTAELNTHGVTII